jgi:hypothetical protein
MDWVVSLRALPLVSCWTMPVRSPSSWTVGLYGNESSSGADDYLRMSTVFVLTVTFDIPPATPTGLKTSPAATGAQAACTTSGDGWIGATTYTNSSSNMSLASTVTSNVSGENVAAHYHVWDRTVLDSAGNALDDSTPSTGLLASGTQASAKIGFTLKDGHEYGWDVYAKDKVGLTSAISDHCWFKTDFTPPLTPQVATNPSFPPVGSGASGTVVYAGPDASTTFTVTGSDAPASDTSCTPGPCLSSGIAKFQWSLDSPVNPTSSPTADASTSGSPATASIPVPLHNWGVHTLYVVAVDAAGNASQAPYTYTFTVPWNPGDKNVPGDVTGDHSPDLLVPTKTGDLEVIPGDTDPAQTTQPVQTGPVTSKQAITGPTIVSTADQAPGGNGWNNLLLSHRGNFHGADGDDLYAYDKNNNTLYLVKNDLDPTDDASSTPYSTFPGYIGKHFDQVAKPACADAKYDADDNRCRDTDYDDAAPISQLLVVGNVYGNAQGFPAVVTVENGELWIYQASTDGELSDPTLLGNGDWSNLTLLAPGTADGAGELWARDKSTGALYSWPLTLDASGRPTLLHPDSGTALPLTLPPASYPYIASPGDSNGVADGSPDGCPDLYAITAAGSLVEYQGQISGSTCTSSFGAQTDLGSASDTSTHWWNLDDGGTTATDHNGALNATLQGSASWATDAKRGTTLALNGTDGYATTSSSALDTSQSFTVSAWIKLGSSSANSTFISQSDAGGNTNGFQIYYSSNVHAWAFNRHNGDNTTASDFTGIYSSTKPATGTWTHLVAVYNAQNGAMALYVNGDKAASGTYTGTDWDASGTLQIGRRQYAGTYGEYANGQISDVRIYPTALSATDAASQGDVQPAAGLS